jgi:hypothetical protein
MTRSPWSSKVCKSFSVSQPMLLFITYQPDGKEARIVMKQAANDVDQIKRLSTPSYTNIRFMGSTILTGNQLRQDLRRWLSPPDPSTNHNIACSAHYEGTAAWFFQGGIFREWKTTDSLLWIHGKCTFVDSLSLFFGTNVIFEAGSGKSVLWFVHPQSLSVVVY